MQRLVRFCRLLAVRCYYASFRIRLLPCTRKTSPGKRNYLHLIYLLHLRLEFRAISDFVLSCKLVHFKTPFMQFLLVRPRFCLRLLSDSASRRAPLSLADSSYCHACSGLSPPSYYACRAHKNKAPLLPEMGFVSNLKGLRTLVLNPLSVICALLRSRVESPI